MTGSVVLKTEVIETGRIAARFASLKTQKKTALITFITAGDPDLKTSAQLLAGLPNAGADIIEFAMPFSDPMADGSIIQTGNLRAFKAGINATTYLDMMRTFRKEDTETPVVLMGYYNPIYAYGVKNFLADAKEAGVDGLIIVDLPPEEDAELCEPAIRHGLNFIRLVTPTTDAKRMPAVLKNASGFLYYVSMAGVTGTKAVNADYVAIAVTELRKHSRLPIGVGFGITTPEQAKTIAKYADAVIVGSAIVSRIASSLGADGKAKPGLVDDVLGFVEGLAKAVHNR